MVRILSSIPDQGTNPAYSMVQKTNKQKGKYELTVFADQELRYGLSGYLGLKVSLYVTIKLLVSSCRLIWMLSCGNGVGMVEQRSSKVIHRVVSELHSLSDYWNEASVPSCGLSTRLLTRKLASPLKWAKTEKEKSRETEKRAQDSHSFPITLSWEWLPNTLPYSILWEWIARSSWQKGRRFLEGPAPRGKLWRPGKKLPGFPRWRSGTESAC